ncbi:universal stress protein [Herbidospora sp. NEAU-GS84]|uniref:Universal stress protein n=1 Tax=Herbidospora solisilvae TaxID=2696284 RepID=A0A7C9JFI5_9ACTN|nr:universal stress protein [Herbidospora solisilvae]NAS26004.1 universal stress protein [Herbidospora solisilvae]
MTSTIVVGVDGSAPSLAAVEYAARDAARRNAALRIVHVWPPLTVGDNEVHATERAHHEGIVAEAQRRAWDCAPDIEISAQLIRGDVIDRLNQEAMGADEVVIGSRGMGGFAGLILGSVGLALAGHTAGPVVVVRKSPRHTYGELVVGYDGSEESETALDYAFAEAQRRQARLKLVYAWQPPVLAASAAGYGALIQHWFDEQTTFVRQRLAPWTEKFPTVPVEHVGVCGHPVYVLSEESRTADLVIVGSRGRGVIRSTALGSVGHGLLHRAHCPIAIVTEKEDRR